jgi:hypothetical protein
MGNDGPGLLQRGTGTRFGVDKPKLGGLAPRANARPPALVRASLDDDVRRRVAG